MKASLIVPLALVSFLASTQAQPDVARDSRLIQIVKRISVHKLDDALPDVSFEKWLGKESGPNATFHWEVNDCGEQSGNPSDSGPIPTCVEVDSTLTDGREIVIFIADNGPKNAQKSDPHDWKIFFAQLTSPHEKIYLRRLSDLPAALIRTHQLVNHPEIAK